MCTITVGIMGEYKDKTTQRLLLCLECGSLCIDSELSSRKRHSICCCKEGVLGECILHGGDSYGTEFVKGGDYNV